MKGETLVRILVVDDDPAHARAICRSFADHDNGKHFTIDVAGTLEEFRRHTEASVPDIALLDHPPESGRFPVIVMTSHGDEQTAVEAMKRGALDYVVKSPESFAAMPRTVARALREWNLLQEHKRAYEAMRKRQHQFEALADNAPDVVARFDTSLRYLCINKMGQ